MVLLSFVNCQSLVSLSFVNLPECGFPFVCDCRTLPENGGMARWDPEARHWTFPAAAMKAMEAALKERLPELHVVMPPKFAVAMLANPLTEAGRHHLPFALTEVLSFHVNVVISQSEYIEFFHFFALCSHVAPKA